MKISFRQIAAIEEVPLWDAFLGHIDYGELSQE
jgi:hypothetical protein